MSFVPALPGGGYVGWSMLQRTQAKQMEAFSRQASVQRDEAYFREKIGKIDTAEQLVNDHRLLRVALGAFGLEADIKNKFFIRKVLEEGTLTDGALAMKLADKRYREFAAAFGFGNFATPRSKLSDFADKTLGSWKERQFEQAVGQVDESLRLAMNATREIAKIAKSASSEDVKWFNIMGQPPLRQVMETVFSLPSVFGTLDIDRQKEVLVQKSEALFGSGGVSQFAEPGQMDKLIKRYVLQAQISGSNAAAANSHPILMLLSSPRRF